MSALKTNFRQDFLHQVDKLQSIWQKILPKLEKITVEEIIKNLENTSLDIAGVSVGTQQCTLEKIAGQIYNTDVSDLLYVLHGLSLSFVTGEVHPYLKDKLRMEWIPLIFSLKIFDQPIFISACSRSLKIFVEWLVDIMEESRFWAPIQQRDANGDTALHIAIRNRQWDWAEWLVGHGASPYLKNKNNESSIMLTAPHHECLNIFKERNNSQWFDALHDALVYGKKDATWCVELIGLGADINQKELYDAPLDSLIVLAKQGMDMNLGPLPNQLLAEQLQIFYWYGHEPRDWRYVLMAFKNEETDF